MLNDPQLLPPKFETDSQICLKIHGDIFQQLDKDFGDASKDGAFCWTGQWPGSCLLVNIKLVKYKMNSFVEYSSFFVFCEMG